MLLHAQPKRWYSWDFEIRDDSGPLANIRMSHWKEKADLSIHGKHYIAYREGPFYGAFLLEDAGTVVVRAVKPSAFRQKFIISNGDRELTLEPESAFRRKLTVFEQSAPVGSISPTGAFSRGAAVQLPESLSIAAKVFIVWLSLILWKRGADAAGA